MRFDYKLWIELDGLKLGHGRIKVLKSLLRTGSISATARELSMSYRYAWGIVKKMSSANPPLVRVWRGGPGGVEVTEEGRRVIERYREMERGVESVVKYGPSPSITVDGVVLSGGEVLLVKRARPPFENMWALPGGFVRYGERLSEAAVREVEEETGLRCEILQFVGFEDSPLRDPRGHTITAVFLLEVTGGELRGGDDASEARFFSPNNLPPLAFDHGDILKKALRGNL